MKKIFLTLFLGMFLIHAIPVNAQNDLASHSPKPEILPMSDFLNRVSDSKTKDIVTQIEKRLFAINASSCEITKTNISEKGVIQDQLSLCFKRPDYCFSKSIIVKHPIPFFKDSTTYLVMDGKILWQYIQNAPGSAKGLLQGKNIPQAQAEAFIKQHETPKILKYDILRLRQAGKNEIEHVLDTKLFLNPFHQCDPQSLKLEREDENAWIFLTKPSSTKLFQNLDFIRLFIGKETGLRQKMEFVDKDGKTFYAEEVSNVKINPDFPPNQFAFHPPQGIEIKDPTETILNMPQSPSGGSAPH